MKGWDYKATTWTRKITRGQTIEVERVSETGYLWLLYLSTDDCYGGASIEMQGADLRSITSSNVYPKATYDIGALMQDPSGWVQRYYRPNPQSSQGIYFVPALTLGFQGSTMPYVPTTIIRFFLKEESTQAEATVSLSVLRIILTDKKQFIKSIRALTGANIIQEIDTVLLSAGPADINQRGWAEKANEGKK
jgi:hypothetical protein